MTSQEVKELLHGAPFVPFTIFLSNGRSFRVDHHDVATLSKAGQVLAISLEGNAFALVDLLQATHVETHPPQPAESV
jgi:hypothetical protein